jgi:hypothetical protein
MKHPIRAVTSILLLSVLVPSPAAQAAPALPSSWILGENASSEPTDEGEEPIDPDEGVGTEAIASVDSILAAQSRAIEGTVETAPRDEHSFASKPGPADWVPWRLAYFATDLSVSLSGWVGALVNKGTPTVTLYWRKQGPKPASPGAFAADSSGETARITSASTPVDLVRELEPAIRSALASGRIRDESRFRENLLAAAGEFRDATSRLEGIGKGEWWVSRLRADLSVDASGKLGPVTTLGGEAKIRLEWHRLMRNPSEAPKPAASLRAPSTFFGTARFGEGLVDLASGLAEDLDATVDPRIEKRGFKAYSYRIGIGVSKKGDVGVAQATTTLFAHLYFSRDVAKPVVRPSAAFAPPLRSPATVKLVADGGEDGVVLIDRGRFRKGLHKALRIGRFFAKRAERAHAGKWKVYDLRTGFEISLAGKTGTARVNALGAADFSFYNQNF